MYSIHDMSVEDRPRERLLRLGPGSLSSVELVAVLLGRGNKSQPVMSLAHDLLSRFEGLPNLTKVSPDQLMSTKGLGPAKVCQLLAALELTRRVGQESTNWRSQRALINQPEQLAAAVRNQLIHPDQEHFWVISLSSRNHLLAIDLISRGTIDAALVHPRETYAAAIRRLAAKIIVCHNHPSGDSQPSEDDLLITKRLVSAGKIIGIPLIDHIVITEDGYYSLQRHGQIK